jgi:uncharacterized glyoxalase superfamily protein PhnB
VQERRDLMSEPFVPDGYSRVTPYLTVSGAGQLLDFIVAVFDAQILDDTRHEDNQLAHGALRIGDAVVELAEATDNWGPTPGALHVYVPDVDETHGRAVAKGAQVLHEPMDMEYGERASAVRDATGNTWYIATCRR